MATKNPIERAVLPLKQDAMARAKMEAENTAQRVREELAEAEGDINKTAPYPSTWGKDALYGIKYQIALIRYNLFHSLVKRDETKKTNYGMNAPSFVIIDEAKVERFIKQRIEWAARDYDAFVAKLVAKIGEVKKAVLYGNHVWSFSTLIVTMPDGELQAWKTQQIVNHSKLGKPFNQWPTRRLKKVPEMKVAA